MRPITEITPALVRALMVAVVEKAAELDGRVFIETKMDRRSFDSPYCTLWFKSLLFERQDLGKFIPPENENDEGRLLMPNLSYGTIQISLWGNGAYDRAVKIGQDLQSAERWWDLWSVIGFSDVDEVRDISAEYGAKIQQRAYFDFRFYVCFGRLHEVGWFNRVAASLSLPDKPYFKEWVMDGGARNGNTCSVP